MRFVLVVLFLVALHLAHRPSPPAIPERPIARNAIAQDSIAQNAIVQHTTSKPPSSAPLRTPPSAGSNPPVITGAANAPPAETADIVIEQPAPRTGETERPGEERTSQRGALKPGDIEADMQRELIRLACLRGRPEKGWGSRSRSALRRFVARAKPKDGGAPSETLLRAMRSFPANYCKLCNPGRAGCKIRPAPQKRSDIETPVARKQPAAPEAAYLPPWMLQDDGRVVIATEDNAAPEEVAKVRSEVRADIVAHAPPAASPSSSARQNRRRRIVIRPRPSRFRKTRDLSLPTLNGWPRRY